MSGIYIPGMKMPKCCAFCELYENDLYWCRAAKKEYIEYAKNEAHPDWCPLVPVPAHKGPLVDALEVINTFPEEFIFTEKQARALTNYIIPADIEEEEGE